MEERGGRGEPQNNMTSTRKGERGGAVYFVQNSERRKIIGNVVQNVRRHGTRKQHKLDKGFHCHKSTHAEFCDQVGSSNMERLHRSQNMFRCGLNKPRTRRGNEKQHTSSTKMNNFLKRLATHRMGISMGPHGETLGDSPQPCRECAFASGLYFSLHSIREHHTDKTVKLFAFFLTHF